MGFDGLAGHHPSARLDGPGRLRHPEHSTADYGCLWQGERRSGAAGREAIRSAHEFGGNLLALAEARRQKA